MANNAPEAHPASVPPEPSDAPDQLSPTTEPRRESVESVPGGDAGDPGGTMGTGGTNRDQDG